MKRGYYLWDWHGTRTIYFDSTVEFLDNAYATSQGAFKRFKDCKEHGIDELELEIAELQADLERLKAMKRCEE